MAGLDGTKVEYYVGKDSRELQGLSVKEEVRMKTWGGEESKGSEVTNSG